MFDKFVLFPLQILLILFTTAGPLARVAVATAFVSLEFAEIATRLINDVFSLNTGVKET